MAPAGGAEAFVEPRDAVKGDIARAVMYMAIAYDMPLMVDRELLIRWHLVDLPDDAERARNDAIKALQGTRNPFVDDPELAGLIGP